MDEKEFKPFEAIAEEMNKKAVRVMQNLEKHDYFGQLEIIEERIHDNKDPLDKAYYLSEQDQINSIYGEILIAYYELLGCLKTYVAVKKQNAKVEAEAKGGKLPGDELLKDIARGEVADLYRAVILLEGWVERGENDLRTCRNHAISGREGRGEGGKEGGEERTSQRG
jgi:hypothetical protein